MIKHKHDWSVVLLMSTGALALLRPNQIITKHIGVVRRDDLGFGVIGSLKSLTTLPIHDHLYTL
jgi:hypothetical protein